MDTVKTKLIEFPGLSTSDITTALLPVPKWTKITKAYTDFSTAALTNSITIYSLTAKEVVHGCIAFTTGNFKGGAIVTYTISVGVTGNNVKYMAALDAFGGGTFTGTVIAPTVEDITGVINITATAISTVANLNAATQGAIDIWLLTSTLP
jgi:hypothetical protein